MPRFSDTVGRLLLPLITPFMHDDTVDHDRVGELANYVLDREYGDALIVSGTTGEFYALTLEERVALLRAVKEAVGNRAPLIAGTGAACTKHAIALTKAAADIGYDAVMVVTPFYSKPTQEGMRLHFEQVAAATDRPLMLYNIPLFSGVNLEPPTVAALAKLPNIVAIKEEAGVNPTQTSDFILGTPDDFEVYCGDDTMLLQVLSQGGVGTVSGGSHVIGDLMRAAMDAFLAGDNARATELHLKMYPFFKALLGAGRVNGTPLVREALALTWQPVGPPRMPQLPASEAEREALVRVLSELGKL
ncbi:MAG TPA: 4-hydroxy-tetrahydrodipicolinate synthase [Armatimonadota bacterium]|nr:4-hydroxy-tetrahydrodipicolinate synthase [Armatimonadota bacterium]